MPQHLQAEVVWSLHRFMLASRALATHLHPKPKPSSLNPPLHSQVRCSCKSRMDGSEGFLKCGSRVAFAVCRYVGGILVRCFFNGPRFRRCFSGHGELSLRGATRQGTRAPWDSSRSSTSPKPEFQHMQSEHSIRTPTEGPGVTIRVLQFSLRLREWGFGMPQT